MRKPNSISEIKQDRDHALLQVFRSLVGTAPTRIDRLSQMMVSSPAPRFWVSEERASIVISQMMRGIDTSGMSATKTRMYREIYTRVRAVMQARPRMRLLAAIREVIDQPAPEFYVTPRYAMHLIRNRRR